MTKFSLYIILSTIISFSDLYAQPGWNIQAIHLPFGSPYQINNTSDAFVFGDGNLILKSTDDGLTWNWIQAPKNGKIFDQSGVFFLNKNTGWVSGRFELFKTINNGNSWSKISDSSKSYLYFSDEMNGWGSFLNFSLYRTYNGGLNWIEVNPPSPEIQRRFFHFISQSTGLMVEKKYGHFELCYIYKTIDYGNSWVLKDSLNLFLSYDSKPFEFIDANTGWILGDSKILKTTDSGTSWTHLNNPGNSFKRISFVSEQSGWLSTNSFNLYSTSTGGNTWENIFNGNEYTSNIKLFTNTFGISTGDENSKSVLRVTTDSGINWNPIFQSVNTEWRKINFINNNTGFVSGASDKFLKTTNSGSNWSAVNFPKPSIALHFVNENTGFYSPIFDAELHRTINGGSNWMKVLDLDTIGHFTSINFIDENTGWAAGVIGVGIPAHGKIYKTTNSGVNWNLQYENLQFAIDNLFSLDQNNHWASAEYGADKIVKSTNGGSTWELVSIPGARFITSVYFINSQTGWLTTRTDVEPPNTPRGVVMKSTDGGDTWITQNNTFVHLLSSVFAVNENIIYATGDYLMDPYMNLNISPLYKSTDSGNNWLNLYTPVNDLWLKDVQFINDETGWAVGRGGVVMKTIDGGSVSIPNNEVLIPNEFQLRQNYPNPFNSFTTISFALPIDANINLKLYDLTGREVKTITSKFFVKGEHKVLFDATGLPSGIYFYVMTSIVGDGDVFQIAKKLALVK